MGEKGVETAGAGNTQVGATAIEWSGSPPPPPPGTSAEPPGAGLNSLLGSSERPLPGENLAPVEVAPTEAVRLDTLYANGQLTYPGAVTVDPRFVPGAEQAALEGHFGAGALDTSDEHRPPPDLGT
jgi:hypothetical protein